MTVTVTPNSDRNTHHIKLSDGVTDIGLILCNGDGSENARAFRRDPIPRSAIKMYSGEQRHSDLEPPWQDVAITDFSGGRGGEKYEDDTTKYWDGMQIDTTRGYAILAPLLMWDKNREIKKHKTYFPWHLGATYSRYKYTAYPMYGATKYIAYSFVPLSTFTPYYLYFFVKKVGSPDSTMVAYVCDDDSGKPGAVKSTFNVMTPTSELQLLWAEVSNSSSISSGSTYWLLFQGATNSDASNYMALICDGSGSGEKISSDGTNWSSGSTGAPYYRVEEAGKGFRSHFAVLNGSLYCAAEYADGTVSKIFQDGIAGTATAGAVSYLRDANNSAAIADDTFNGGILHLLSGTGSHIPSPWGYISDTLDANSEIDVSLPIAPSTDTTYSVIGADRWFEVTGHGLTTEYISDLLSVNGALYAPLGPGANMKRFRHYWNSTATSYFNWTTESISTTFIRKLADAATVGLWCANRTVPAQIYSASALDCTGTATVTSLSWSSAIGVGDKGEKITNMWVYGEDFPILHVFKEGSIHKVISGVPQEFRISALSAAADERNGYAAGVNDVYLYFSFLDSVERYFDGSLDDIGPNQNGGLPYDRRGMISDFAMFPGRTYAAIDGGTENHSSIIVWNGQGWHEIFREPYNTSDFTRPRIMGRLYIQPMPGDNVERLFFSWNGDIISLPVVGNPFNHNSKNTAEGFQFYAFAPGGSIETGWIHFGLEEVDKLFNAVTVVGENLSSTYSKVYLDYKCDDDSSYTTVGQFTISGDSGELALDDTTHNITGKRIRLRIRLETLYNNSTPKITAIVLEGLTTLPHKYTNTLTFRVNDYGFNLLNEPEDITDADTIMAKLDEWASSAGTIAMSGHIDALNGKRVKIEPASIHILKHEVEEVNYQKKNEYIVQATILEVD